MSFSRGLWTALIVLAPCAGWAADADGLRRAGVFNVVDAARAAAQGIHRIEGKRLALWTDLELTPEIRILPEVFDQAFPQWCAFFGRTPQSMDAWRMTGFLIGRKERFQAAGLMPPAQPEFRTGYSQNDGLWLYEQPNDYYRRHLLLHEGTHGFMNLLCRVMPPPWYQEGIAELLSTHRWHDGRLEMNYLPATRDELPLWGRVRIIQDAVAKHRARHLGQVLAFDGQSHGSNEFYGWCWTAAAMLTRDPRYRDRFQALTHALTDGDTPSLLRDFFAVDRREMSEQWQLTVVDLDYGYDFARASVEFAPGRPLPPDGAEATIAADRGWQSARISLEAGETYRLEASGRYQVAAQPQPWWCEPGGVSIRYYKGLPLGILMAAVRPDEPAPGVTSALLRPTVVGLGTTLTLEASGTLYLKINDSPAELADNAGQLHVRLKRGHH